MLIMLGRTSEGTKASRRGLYIGKQVSSRLIQMPDMAAPSVRQFELVDHLILDDGESNAEE